MAFQLDSNVYSKQKSLSDYIAVNEARDLQRAQAEQSMAASDMAMEAARQKKEMEAVGMGLAGATEADYPARRQALLKQGVPEQFLPEQYNPALIDAIMTKTGYKSKPSLAEQLMQPLSMMMGVQQPTPEPTQSAAPTTPQGSITTQPVGNIDQYATDSGITPPANNASLDDIVSQARAMEAGQTPTPAPNQQMMPPTLPAQIPDTNLNTPIPAYQPKTVGGAFEADKAAAKASAENQALATKPITPAEQAKLDADKAKTEQAETAKALEASNTAIGELNTAARLLEDYNAKVSEAPEMALGPVAGRLTSAAGYTPTRNLESAQNALTLSMKALLKMPSANFSDADRDFITKINDAVTSGKGVGQDASQRIARLLETAAKTEQDKLAYIKKNGTVRGYSPTYTPPSLNNTSGSSGGGAVPKPKFLGFE